MQEVQRKPQGQWNGKTETAKKKIALDGSQLACVREEIREGSSTILAK